MTWAFIAIPIVLAMVVLGMIVCGIAIVASSPTARKVIGRTLVGIGVFIGAMTFLKAVNTPRSPDRAHEVAVEVYSGESTKIEVPVASPSDPVDETPKPTSRPDWVTTSNSATNGLKVVLHVGPETSRSELQNAMQRKLAAAAADFCGTQFGPLVEPLQIPAGDLQEKLVANSYTEKQDRSIGSSSEAIPVYDHWVLVDFTPTVRRFLETHWQNAMVKPRLWLAGEAALGVLALLGVGYTYLKLTEKKEASS